MNRQQLADAMLKGVNTPGVVENRRQYIATVGRLCHACAIGAAVIGKFNGDFHEAEKAFDRIVNYRDVVGEVRACATLLEISPALAIEIEHKHLNGQTIEQIAAWLKGGES